MACPTAAAAWAVRRSLSAWDTVGGRVDKGFSRGSASGVIATSLRAPARALSVTERAWTRPVARPRRALSVVWA